MLVAIFVGSSLAGLEGEIGAAGKVEAVAADYDGSDLANHIAGVVEVRTRLAATGPVVLHGLLMADAYDCCRHFAHAQSVEPVPDYGTPISFSGSAIEGAGIQSTFSGHGHSFVAPRSPGARFVAGSDGVIDTVGGSPNAVTLLLRRWGRAT